MSGRFAGQVAVVTGAGAGIGRASAQRLAADGAHVVVNDIDTDAAAGTVAAVAQAGGSAEAEVGDVLESGYVQDLFDRIMLRHKHIDIVHNNVGFGARLSIVETSDEAWERGIDGNLGAAFRGVRAAIRAMAPRGRGAVVNTSSLAGLLKVPGVAPYYGVAKAAVIQLTREAAVEAGQYGIRVNAVVPGSVRAASLERYLGTGDRWAAYTEQLPLHRMVEPADIANVVAFLASDEAATITGVAIPVDSGMSAVMYQPNID